MNYLQCVDCPVCQHQHNFCSTNGAVVLGRAYEFHCPEKGQKGFLIATSRGESIQHYPQGAVSLNNRVIAQKAA